MASGSRSNSVRFNVFSENEHSIRNHFNKDFQNFTRLGNIPDFHRYHEAVIAKGC